MGGRFKGEKNQEKEEMWIVTKSWFRQPKSEIKVEDPIQKGCGKQVRNRV